MEVETLRELRLPEGGRPDAVIEVSVGDVTERFVVEAKARAPYPNEVDHVAEQIRALATTGRPMLIAPYVSEPLGEHLIESGVSWADTCGNFDLRASTLVLRQRLSNAPPKPQRSALPQGSGGLAIVRCLINFTEDTEKHTGTALAAQAGVSQPRASQVLHQLLNLDLVARSESGRWASRREALLDRFLAEYRGPGGSELFLYSLDPPSDVAARAATSPRIGRIAVSADVGPDLIAAWRRPTHVIIYSDSEFDPSAIGTVEASGRDDANVIVRTPNDRSVFPSSLLVAEYKGVQITLADATQQIWDLGWLGGADRLEAAGSMRSWLLTR